MFARIIGFNFAPWPSTGIVPAVAALVAPWIVALGALVAPVPLAAQAAGDGLPVPLVRLDFETGNGGRYFDPSSDAIGSPLGAVSAPGIRDEGVAFDGSGHVALTGAAGTPCPAGICALQTGSIAIWFRIDRMPSPTGIHSILTFGDAQGSATPRGFVFEVGHASYDGRLFFTLYTGFGTPALCFDTGFDLETGRWYHFVLVIGPDFNTGYLDGRELVDRHYNYGWPSDRYFFSDIAPFDAAWIGRGVWGLRPSHFAGAVDDLAIYDRPLGPSEVLAIYEAAAPVFRRGDADGDGTATITDAVHTLEALFTPGGSLDCEAAADVNADRAIDVSDAVRLLLFLFAGAPPPPAPFLDCGSGQPFHPCAETTCGE